MQISLKEKGRTEMGDTYRKWIDSHRKEWMLRRFIWPSIESLEY